MAKQQVLQRTPAIASYCLLTRRERACLVTLIDTASGLSISTSHDPKVVHLSVLYGCDRLASRHSERSEGTSSHGMAKRSST